MVDDPQDADLHEEERIGSIPQAVVHIMEDLEYPHVPCELGGIEGRDHAISEHDDDLLDESPHVDGAAAVSGEVSERALAVVSDESIEEPRYRRIAHKS